MTRVLLCGFLAAAAFSDQRTHRIPNVIVYSGILALSCWRLFREGSDGGLSALTGCFTCGGLILLCYLLFDIGGGDVKLMAMIGAALGAYDGIEAMLWTFALAAGFALARIVWKVGTLRCLMYCLRPLQSAAARQKWAVTLPPTEKQVSLSLPALAGVLILMWPAT